MDVKIERVVIAVLAVALLGVGYLLYSATGGRFVGSGTPSAVPTPDPKWITQSSSESALQTDSRTIHLLVKNSTFGPTGSFEMPPVRKGTSVVWTNGDEVEHQIVSDPNGAAFKSPNLKTGEEFSYTFNRTGTFSYHCGIHPNMKGKITVTD